MAKQREVASAERLAAEGGIASDESAVAEPEIVAGDGPVKEPEKEPDERSAAEGDSGDAGCPIEMGVYGDPKCGRKLHIAPAGVDEHPVCLMHSKDPGKQSGVLFIAFWQEFERILERAEENVAHFERFVFPSVFFWKKEFKASCRFYNATFTRNAVFWSATFAQEADFEKAIFTQDADFWNVTFIQFADFQGTRFTRNVDFFQATFTQNAGFNGVTFTQNAGFGEANFTQDAFFFEATFTLKATFEKTKFYGRADWQSCQFLDGAEFRHTEFKPKKSKIPSAVFVLANFAKPIEVVFDGVDLSRALFHNCDVSAVWFTSTVHWAKRKNDRGLVVFEEEILLDPELTYLQKIYGSIDHGVVAQLYQQLKKNYDGRLDYWTANEFHFGEMEMKRLAGPTKGPFRWLRQWWHRNLSFVAWYKYASNYGNSYGWPLFWLFVILLAAALLFPIPGVGLMKQGATQAETYASVWDFSKSWGDNFSSDQADATLFGKGLIASVDTATFQRNAEYTPTYPWGRVVAIVETLLTSSLFALFLLAIRRQFRR
jgi:hypothetical protein